MQGGTFLVRTALVVAITLVGCSGRGCGKTKANERPVYKVIASPPLEFSRFEVASSEFPHASSARGGRVAVTPRRYAELVALASLEDGRNASHVPRFIDLAPRADSVVIERSGPNYSVLFDVRSRAGALVFSRGGRLGDHALARDDRVFMGDGEYSWSGERGEMFVPSAGTEGGEQVACAVTRGEVRMLVASRSEPPNHGPTDPDYTYVEMSALEGPNAATRFGWSFKADEPGVGAIDGSSHTVVALPSGRLVVLRPDGDASRHAAGLDVPVDPNATHLSIVPPFAMVLYGGGAAGELAALRSASFAASRLDARRPDGSLAWRVSVDFLAEQPPVDGTDRVYLVGKGIAAFNLEGHLQWSSPSPVTLRAAAFADGTLAVTRGSELQVVAPDGSIRQSFRAGETLTSSPRSRRTAPCGSPPRRLSTLPDELGSPSRDVVGSASCAKERS